MPDFSLQVGTANSMDVLRPFPRPHAWKQKSLFSSPFSYTGAWPKMSVLVGDASEVLIQVSSSVSEIPSDTDKRDEKPGLDDICLSMLRALRSY